MIYLEQIAPYMWYTVSLAILKMNLIIYILFAALVNIIVFNRKPLTDN